MQKQQEDDSSSSVIADPEALKCDECETGRGVLHTLAMCEHTLCMKCGSKSFGWCPVDACGVRMGRSDRHKFSCEDFY